MTVDEIRAYCLSFAETSEKLQWGDALCFKVRGKMFAVIGLDQVRLTFKCTPEGCAELIEQEGIQRAPYVGRYDWVMLDRLDALGRNELRDRIAQSYEIVAAKAPKKAKRSPAAVRSARKRGSTGASKKKSKPRRAK